MSILDKKAGAAVVGAGSGLVNTAFGFLAARQQYKNQRRLMELQNQYDIEAFNRQNARQDWLMRNEDSLKRQSLENAGYSTADPQGTGVTTPSVASMDTPGTPTSPMMPGSPGTDFVNAFSAIRQAELIDSVKRKNEAEAKKAEEEGKGVAIQNEYIRPRSEAEVKQMLQDIELKKKQGKLNDVQADTAERLCKATENKTAAECQEIAQVIENAKQEYRRLQEQVNLLKTQQDTERSVQAYNRASAFHQQEQGNLTRQQILGQKWQNVALEQNAGIAYIQKQQEQIKYNLRQDLAQHGVDLDNKNIGSMIGQGIVMTVHRGVEGLKTLIDPYGYRNFRQRK